MSVKIQKRETVINPTIIPYFFIDSLPDIQNSDCRELLRFIEKRKNIKEYF